MQVLSDPELRYEIGNPELEVAYGQWDINVRGRGRGQYKNSQVIDFP